MGSGRSREPCCLFVRCTTDDRDFDHKPFTEPVVQAMTTAFQRFREGDTEAFDQVVTEYSGPGYAVAVQVLRNPSLAEEAVQEAMLRLWKQGRQFDPARGNERSWILSICRNQAIDLLRKRNRHPERSIEDLPSVYALQDPEDVWQSVMASMTGEVVREALETLPPEQRDTVVQAYYGGLRPVEIARRLQLPEGTVRSRLRLGLARLREALAPVKEGMEP
jgi:RNA polymerase sigma-70 factor, ECF subfamily